MGACFNSKTYPPMLSSELEQKYREMIEQLRFERGNDGYNGTFTTNSGLSITTRQFPDLKAADEWLENNARKWEDVLAVRFGAWPALFEETPQGRDLVAKRQELEKAYEGFDLGIIRRVRSAKSKTKGCKKCGSSIAVSHIHEDRRRYEYLGERLRIQDRHPALDCPVCGHAYLLTDTDTKRRAALLERLKAVQQKEREARAKYAAKHYDGRSGWALGGWSSM